jgi:hypothetical protein
MYLFLCTNEVSAKENIQDCNLIRAKVAEHGRAKAIVWARQQGYSWADIWRVRKQCKV